MVRGNVGRQVKNLYFYSMAINPLKPFQLPTKNYRQVAVVEIALIFLVLMLGDLAQLVGWDVHGAQVKGVLLIPEAMYLFILYQLAIHLQPHARARQVIRGVVILIFILSGIGLNPFISVGDAQVPVLIAVHTLLCGLECYLIALGLQDIYLDRLSLKDRLWGSAAMYLLIAIGWASFYEIFLLIDHSAFGPELIPGYQTYAEALYFSLCSLSGTGTVYSAPVHFMRNFALIEAVWGVLFLVMLIGRVFSNEEKPA